MEEAIIAKTPEILPTDRTANDLAPAEPPSIVPELGPLVSSAASYARSARAERTLKEYAKQWATFTTWCAEHELCEASAATRMAMVQRYHRRGRKWEKPASAKLGILGQAEAR